jgi:plasmid stability protein
MPVLTVRNLSDETHRALRLRAAVHGRSTEAEVRSILEESVRPPKRIKIGSELAAFAQKHGGIDLKIRRGRAPIRGADFK